MQSFGVPRDVLARDTQAGEIAVEIVQVAHVGQQHLAYLDHFRRCKMLARVQEMFDLAEQPRTTLRGTTDHHGIHPSLFQYETGFFGCSDVAIGDDGDAHCVFHRADGVVLGIAGVGTSASATMDGKGLDTAGFCDVCDVHCVAILFVPAGTDLQGDGHVHCTDHFFQYLCHQFLVLHQCRTGHHVADLLGGTAHVDIDDLCAVVHVVTRGLGEHLGIGTDDLHGDGIDLAFMIGAAFGLLGTIEQGIGCDHLGYGHACAHAFAQHTERPIGHACHRRDNQIVLQYVFTDLHEGCFQKGADYNLINCPML
jgi:hypothetical protein